MDTKVANALLGAVTAAAVASELVSRDATISGLPRRTPAPSPLTPCSRLWTLPQTLRSRRLSWPSPRQPWTQPSSADASVLASLLSTVVGLPLEVDTKIAMPAGQRSLLAGTPARHDVQYFPSSLSSFSPTTSRVCHIPPTSSTSFIDPESIKIAFRVRNTDGTNPHAQPRLLRPARRGLRQRPALRQHQLLRPHRGRARPAEGQRVQPLGGNGHLALLRSHCCRLLYCLRAALHLLRALPCLIQEALHITGPTCDLRRRLRLARTGQHVQAHVLSCVLGQLRAESLRGCKSRCPCAYEVRCRLRAVCTAAQAVRDGGRPLPVAGQGAGLGVSRQVVLNKAGSSLVPPRKAHVLVPVALRESSGCRGVCCRGRGLGSSLDCTKSSR